MLEITFTRLLAAPGAFPIQWGRVVTSVPVLQRRGWNSVSPRDLPKTTLLVTGRANSVTSELCVVHTYTVSAMCGALFKVPYKYYCVP